MAPAHPDNARADSLTRTLQHPVILTLADRLTQLRPVDTPPTPHSRRAAVMVIVRITGDAPGGPELLFIKRAEVAHDPWSGHIAFPGGRHDRTDATLADTAIRETREELAMDIARDGKLLGRLDDLAPVSRALPPIIVRPFVAVVPAELPFQPNAEVAAAFWAPVALLRSAEAQTEHALARNGVTATFPARRVGAHVIWGMTQRILDQTLVLFDGAGSG